MEMDSLYRWNLQLDIAVNLLSHYLLPLGTNAVRLPNFHFTAPKHCNNNARLNRALSNQFKLNRFFDLAKFKFNLSWTVKYINRQRET